MSTSTRLHSEQDTLGEPRSEPDLSLMQVMGSVFAAGFGVQSKETKVRDFTRGNPAHFIIAGLTFTVGLLLALIMVVSVIV